MLKMYESQTTSKNNRQKRSKTQYQQLKEKPHSNTNKRSYQQQSDYVDSLPQINQNSQPYGIYRESENKQMSQIFKHIQDPVNYERMSNQEILAEKRNLEAHVKFLNDQINELVKKKVKNMEDNISRKAQKSKNTSRMKYKQLSNQGVNSLIINNFNHITLLRQQFQYLSKKLDKAQRSDYSLKYDNLIKQTQENINKFKLALFEKKRKNILTGKKITELDAKDNHKDYFQYQQKYVELSKKKEQYKMRVEKVVENNANLLVQLDSLDEHENKLKEEEVSIYKNFPNQKQEQHYKMMYDTKCRKMELALRKRQRDQEEFKRKYYTLLKNYEKALENCQNTEAKLEKTKKDLEVSNQRFKNKQKRAESEQRRLSSQPEITRIWKKQGSPNQLNNNHQPNDVNHEEQQKNDSGFLLTELNNQKSTTKIINNYNKNMKTGDDAEVKRQEASGENRFSIRKRSIRVRTDYGRDDRSNSLYSPKNKKQNQSEIISFVSEKQHRNKAQEIKKQQKQEIYEALSGKNEDEEYEQDFEQETSL